LKNTRKRSTSQPSEKEETEETEEEAEVAEEEKEEAQEEEEADFKLNLTRYDPNHSSSLELISLSISFPSPRTRRWTSLVEITSTLILFTATPSLI
jgi:hypothetical protein